MAKVKYSSVLGRSDLPFQQFIGGRGVGKTYSALSGCATGEIFDFLPENIRSQSKFIYLRRTQNEIENTCTDYANPFKAVNRNLNTEIHVERDKNISLFKSGRDEDSSILGYGCSLSTFSKMRGLDFSDVAVTIFDEFIPEKHVHKISHEGEAFLHFYETVNRNREFEGIPPMRVYMLANAISLNNDILLKMGLVSQLTKMITNGRSRYSDKTKGIYIEIIYNESFRKEKGSTALYKLTGGSSFSKQALDNSFSEDIASLVGKVPLNEYIPYFTIEGYTVYRHKSSGQLYIARKKSSGVTEFAETDRDIIYWRFAPVYRMALLRRMIKFDDYSTKMLFDALTSR